MKEDKLIYRAQGGDESAFGKLYDEYFQRIYRFTLIKVGRKQDAEDLSHQVFLSAWKNIRNYKHKGFPFSSWLYKIAQNAVIDFYRTQRSHIDIEDVREDRLGTQSSSDENLERSMEIERVRKKLLKLKDDEQDVLIMKFIDELSNKEISAALKKSEGAIRVIQHRALKQLKKLLEEDYGR